MGRDAGWLGLAILLGALVGLGGWIGEEALRCNGYSLRNYLVLLKYAEVIEKVLMAKDKGSGESMKPSDLAFQDWLPKAPPLPTPKGEVLRVSSV
jgi:hypothetical protein